MMVMKSSKIIYLLVILMVINTTSAKSYVSHTKIVGVDNQGSGIIGNLTAEVQPGKGRVLINTQPFQGIDLQNSERIAVEVAKEVTDFDFSGYDVIYTIVTPGAHIVDGPSAGGAFTLATIAAIEEKEINPDFVLTGTIQEDGSIGPVGAIMEKAKAAADGNVRTFLIPKGQSVQNQYVRKVRIPAPGWYIETIEPVPVNVITYAKENWDLNVYEVSDIKEAMKYAFTPEQVEKPLEKSKPAQNVTLPKFASPVESYNDFAKMVDAEINRAKENYEKTREKFDSSSLPDDVNIVLKSMFDVSKQRLEEAELANEKGYEYSSGDKAFKSLIITKTANDLIDYSSKGEEYIDQRKSNTKSELIEVRKTIDTDTEGSICSPKNFEWAVASKQRMIYAENKFNSIETDENLQPIDIFYGLNTIEEWLYISKNFISGKEISGTTECIINFKDDAEAAIKTAEGQIMIARGLGLEVTEDAQWYLDAAKKGSERGDYLQALYDATSAHTRASTGIRYEGKGLEEIHADFNELEFTPKSLLGTIYLESAYFRMYEAIKTNSASDAARAMELLILSKNLDELYVEVNKKLKNEPSYWDEIWGSWNKIWSWNYELKISETTILVSIIVVGFIYVIYLKRRLKKLKFEYRKLKTEKELNEDMKLLDDLLKEKKISKEQYGRLKKRLLSCKDNCIT